MNSLKQWLKLRLSGANSRAEDTVQQLPRLYRELHSRQMFVGLTWRNSYELLCAAIPEIRTYKIVDFGCGPRGGLREELGPEQVIAYDPYVEAFSKKPWEQEFDVLFSSDVIEHLPMTAIVEFTEQVARCAPKYIFLNISTRSAEKTFSNGANVHLTVQPTAWWKEFLEKSWQQSYRSTLLRDGHDECTLLFEKRS